MQAFKLKINKHVVEELEKSTKAVGKLQPILVCEQHPDQVLGGNHSIIALGGLGKVKKVEKIDVDAIAAKHKVSHGAAEMAVSFHANKQRRVPKSETRYMMVQLAEELVRAGTPEDVATTLAHLLAFSRGYIDSMLPPQFKRPEKKNSPGRPSKQAKAASSGESSAPSEGSSSNSDKDSSEVPPSKGNLRNCAHCKELIITDSPLYELHEGCYLELIAKTAGEGLVASLPG
jgi:hypothetical protein